MNYDDGFEFNVLQGDGDMFVSLSIITTQLFPPKLLALNFNILIVRSLYQHPELWSLIVQLFY